MEAETVGDTLSDAQALVDRLADSLSEVEGETLGDTLSDAQALVHTMDDSQAKVEAETLSDTLVDTLADLRKNSPTRQATSRAIRRHCSKRWLTL